MSSLSDADVDVLEQLDAGDSDEKFAAMTSDVAVAAAKRLLSKRNHQGEISFK